MKFNGRDRDERESQIHINDRDESRSAIHAMTEVEWGEYEDSKKP